MQESYFEFAKFYDALTENISYAKRAGYFDSIIKKYKRTNGNLLLDLACGTGSLTEKMAELGYDCIGIDGSSEMLNSAFEKKMNSGLDIQYICQDMCEYELYGCADVTICALDSLNHLNSFDDLKKVFRQVNLSTEYGGLFIFDMNTVYKHREILGNNTFIYDTDKVYCVWDNSYSEENNRVDITLDFFERKENGLYSRSGESFSEIAYESGEIISALESENFEILDLYKGDTFEKPDEKTERIIYISKKKEV